jgi:hypothetical protein
MNNLVKLDFGAVDIVNLVSKTTTKLCVKEDMGEIMDKENIDYIVKSAERSDNIIIAWGKLGENNKRVRELQDILLEYLKPYKDKLYIIADTKGENGFHPLAPQIRFTWVLTKYVQQERKESEKTA